MISRRLFFSLTVFSNSFFSFSYCGSFVILQNKQRDHRLLRLNNKIITDHHFLEGVNYQMIMLIGKKINIERNFFFENDPWSMHL